MTGIGATRPSGSAGSPGRGRSSASSVSVRLTASFVLLGLVIVAVAAIGLVVTSRATASVTELSTRRIPLQQNNSMLRSVVVDASGNLRGYVITGDAALRRDYRTSWARYPVVLASARRFCGVEPGACRLLDAQDAAVQRWHREHATPIDAGNRALGLQPAAYRASRQVLNGFKADNDRLTVLNDDAIATAGAAAVRHQRTGLVLLAVSAVLGVLAALVIGVGAVRSLRPPLVRLREVLHRLAAGDLQARAVVEGPAEVRAVSESVNVLAVHSGRLRAEDQARAKVRQLARDLDRRMREHLHADAVADEVVNGIGPLLGVDRVHVRFALEGRAGPVAAQWTSPGTAELPMDQGLSTTDWQAWLESFGPQLQSVTLDAGTTGAAELRNGIDPRLEGVNAALVTPLVAGPEVVGTITVGVRDGGHDWTTAQVSLVEAVAADMGRTVHHARLFEQQGAILGQLRELDRTKSDFLSTISHELRTPLTSIAGYVEMMRDGDAGPVQPMQQNMLEIVGRNTQRLRDLIEDVLMISRVESGAVRSERMPVQVAGLVEQVVTTLRPMAEAGRVRVDVIPTREEGMVLGDPAQLDRVLLNLIGNAIKFTPVGGLVTVSVAVQDHELVLRVQDTGIGIPAPEVDRLFTRFFRASNATSRQIPGTGLGLAIVGSLVDAHDGRVEVDSAEGRGTTFTVTLPLLDAERHASTRAGSAVRV